VRKKKKRRKREGKETEVGNDDEDYQKNNPHFDWECGKIYWIQNTKK
jgi:hypothetical protein